MLNRKEIKEKTNQNKRIAEVIAEFLVSQKYKDLPKEINL